MSIDSTPDETLAGQPAGQAEALEIDAVPGALNRVAMLLDGVAEALRGLEEYERDEGRGALLWLLERHLERDADELRDLAEVLERHRRAA